jgi:hypothetical protein
MLVREVYTVTLGRSPSPSGQRQGRYRAAASSSINRIFDRLEHDAVASRVVLDFARVKAGTAVLRINDFSGTASSEGVTFLRRGSAADERSAYARK